MNTQKIAIKELLPGLEALIRIAKEESSGDAHTAYKVARMQRKVLAHVSEGSVYDAARASLYRSFSESVKLPTPGPDGATERRVFKSDGAQEEFSKQLAELQAKEVDIPIAFLTPELMGKLKMEKPITPFEMGTAWWMFDEASFGEE